MNRKELIDIIMNLPNEDSMRLILETLDDRVLSDIRQKILPHWADGKYGSWSHDDSLLVDLFDNLGKRHYTYKDGYTGDMETDYVSFIRCRCCGEELIQDEHFHDGRYSHVFAMCKVTSELMNKSKSEEDWRKKVNEYIREKENV
jgi:hypothetical protein